MGIQIVPDGEGFIVKRDSILQSNAITGSRSASAHQSRSVTDYWTGSRWSHYHSEAMRYPTEDEARSAALG